MQISGVEGASRTGHWRRRESPKRMARATADARQNGLSATGRAGLRLGVAIGGVDEGLAAGVAGLPIGAGVAIFLTAAIPTDAALGVFVWTAVFVRAGTLEAAVVLGDFFLCVAFLALDVDEDLRGLLGFGASRTCLLFGGALGFALRGFGRNGDGFERHEGLLSHTLEWLAPWADASQVGLCCCGFYFDGRMCLINELKLSLGRHDTRERGSAAEVVDTVNGVDWLAVIVSDID